jgi:DnaJ family protein A protein 2
MGPLLTCQLGVGIVGKVRVPCPDCDGEGQHIRDKDRCKKCKGKKVVKEKKRVEFMIDPGTEDSERIALKGEGDEEVSSGALTAT